MSAKNLVPSVERAIAILDYLSKAEDGVTMSELARQLGIPKSSVHNVLKVLVREELINKAIDGRLRLGPHVLLWSNAVLSKIDISYEFFSAWDELRVLPDETISLSIRDGLEVVYLACRNNHAFGKKRFSPGMRQAATRTATGLAMLSTLDDVELCELLRVHATTDGGGRRTEMETFSSWLSEEVHQIRTRGYSVDKEGTYRDMWCFGAPVFRNNTRAAIAGVSVSLPASRITKEIELRASAAIRALAFRLTCRLGGIYPVVNDSNERSVFDFYSEFIESDDTILVN